MSCMDPSVSQHMCTNCIVVVWYIFWGTGAFPGHQRPKTCVFGPFLRDGVTLTVNHSGLECGIEKGYEIGVKKSTLANSLSSISRF